MQKTIIVATDKNQAIGLAGDLLWSLPRDMKHFKDTTWGHPVLLGRKTYDSIPKKFRPLENRENIVVTTQDKSELNYEEKVRVFSSIQSAIEWCENQNFNELFIAGGAQIYAQCLAAGLVDRIILTKVHNSFMADAYLNGFDREEWKLEKETFYPADEKNNYDITIQYWVKP